VVPIDIKDKTRDGKAVPRLVVSDLTQPDRNAYRQHFKGRRRHSLRLRPAARPDGGFLAGQQRREIPGRARQRRPRLQRLPRGAGGRRAPCRRVQLNHAADYYERLVWDGRVDMVSRDAARSDNWYGWSKASYELLGFVFRHRQGGRAQAGGRAVAHRRAARRRHRSRQAGDIRRCTGPSARSPRRRQTQQAIRMVETEDITDDNGVPFLIVYGIKWHTHRF